MLWRQNAYLLWSKMLSGGNRTDLDEADNFNLQFFPSFKFFYKIDCSPNFETVAPYENKLSDISAFLLTRKSFLF